MTATFSPQPDDLPLPDTAQAPGRLPSGVSPLVICIALCRASKSCW